MHRRHRLALGAILVLLSATPSASADEAGPRAASSQGASEEAKARAREKYLEAVKFVQKAQWSEALATFEASSRLFASPSTTLNMGACERALGRYVRARAELSRALA